MRTELVMSVEVGGFTVDCERIVKDDGKCAAILKEYARLLSVKKSN
mgnify:FL=1